MLHLFEAGGHLLFGAPIDDEHFLCAEPLCRAAGVHRRIASADHHHPLRLCYRRVAFGLAGAHQVHARQVFVRRHHAHRILARYVHKVRQSRAGCHEYRFVSLLFQLRDGDGLAHHAVFHETDAYLPEVVDLHVHYRVGQAEFGDAVFQHAANLVKRLEDGYFKPRLSQIAGARQPSGTRPDNGRFDAVPLLALRQGYPPGLALIVGGKAFKITYRYGFMPHFQVDAAALALLLLRTDAPADRRQRACRFQHTRRIEEIAAFDVLYERRYVDIHGAALYTCRLLAVETTLRLRQRLLGGKPLVHFLRARRSAVDGVEFAHSAAFYRHTLFCFQRAANSLAPRSIIIGELRQRRLIGGNIARRRRDSTVVGMCRRGFHVGGEFLHLLHLLRLERPHALEHLVEVHLMTVELRTVNAHEARPPADGDTARAAHPRAVNHYRVKRHIGRNIVFLCQQTAELHHDGRSDSKALIHLLTPYHLFHTDGYHSLLPVRAVVGHDDHLIGTLSHFFFENNKFLRTPRQHCHDAVAGSFQRLDDGQHRSYAYTAAGAKDGAIVFDMRCLTERSDNIRQTVARRQRA